MLHWTVTLCCIGRLHLQLHNMKFPNASWAAGGQDPSELHCSVSSSTCIVIKRGKITLSIFNYKPLMAKQQ